LAAGSTPCAVRIHDAGLVNRTPQVLQRELHLVGAMVLRMEQRPKGNPEQAAERLTMGALTACFKKPLATTLPAAGWLAGRCTAPDAAGSALLESSLRDALASLDVHRLGAHGPAYVECAMSMGLRGDADAAVAALQAIAAGGGAGSTHDWQGAYYLAQYGDTSGWAAIVAALGSGDEHSRLMATRHLFVFIPYDGTTRDGLLIDAAARLAAALDDPSEYVAVEVPGLLAEAGLDDIRELLADAAAPGRPASVRAAAADVLKIVEHGE